MPRRPPPDPTGRRRAAPWRVAGAAIGLTVTVAMIAIALAIVVVPRALGGTALTVLSGSMEPAFSPGDVVVVRGIAPAEVCGQVRIGQVVTYLPRPNDPTSVTHRVVGKTVGAFDDGTNCRLITQGDANSAADDPVSPVQVRGVFVYGLPLLGWARQWAVNHLVLVGILGGLAAVGYLIWGSVRPPKVRSVTYVLPTRADEPDETFELDQTFGPDELDARVPADAARR